MRSASSFEFVGDLIQLEVRLVSLRSSRRAQLLLDTGAALTTIGRRIAGELGYSFSERVARTKVDTAAGVERGYLVSLLRIEALRWAMDGMLVNVSDVGEGLDGVLGMDFLSNFNFEIRPAEQLIIAEPISLPSVTS
jgi:clan AA aspartic protease (TIGR02281 family)